MNRSKFLFLLASGFISAYLLTGGVTDAAYESEPKALDILKDWRGDYPVAQLDRLPEGQRAIRIGYLDTLSKFTEVWQVFKPGEEVPDIDFSVNLVVFSRNVTFYNRISIVKALLRDGIAEILTMETMSAFPIEDKVAMALAIIPRAGINYIEAGNERIPVSTAGPVTASDPLNATYIIEGKEITLHNGRSEVPGAPDSATKTRTFISGDAVEEDLDGDSDFDAALILVHDPGGSGTFYYVAVAENLNGQYRGTNAVRLGDRTAPMNLEIRNGVVIVRYVKRRPYEPMSTAPSVETFLFLAFDVGKLKALNSIGSDEQILEGWVTIGHEVRSFHPCNRKTAYWISGDSPALAEIMARYKKALPDAKPYTPLFMVLAGKFTEAPRNGYGADYAGAFLAMQLVGERFEGKCK